MSLDRLQRLRPTRRLPAAAALVTAIAALGASLPGAPAAAAVAAGTAPARAAPAPLGAATTPATPGSRTAAEPAGPLSLSVSDVSPLVLTSGGTLTVRGTVRNTNPSTIDSVTVTLRTPGPLASRSAVARWQADTPEDYRGTLVRSQLINTPVAPGARATFSLSAPAGAFGADASAREPQPLGLAVSADAGPGSIRAGSPRVTVVRTFAVWGPRTTDQPVQLSVLVPITQPVAGADAGTAGAHKAADWGPQGRLTRLLAATAVPGVSWAVDPALVAAARDAVGGGGRGQTGTPTASASASLAGSAGASASPSPSAAASTTGAGTAASGAGTEQARAARGWLDLLTAQAAGRDVAALPWADPDLTALAHAGATDLLDKADAQSAAVLAGALNRRVTPLAWPADGVADAAALHAFAARQGRPVVLSGDALAEADRPVGARVDLLVGARGQGTRVVHAVLGDPALGADLTSNGNGAPPAQHLLADLAAAAAEHPGQTLLITAPRTWNPDPNAARRLLSDLGSVPWVSLRPFSELAAAPAAAPARQVPVAYTRADRRRELPPEHVTAVAGADRGLAAFAPALVDPAPVVGRLRPQALSLVSLGWRRHGANALALARTPLTTDVDGLYAGLSVDPGSTKNFLAKEGLLPISVRNGLPYAVDVMLVLTPLSGQLGVKHAVDVRLDANSSRPVFVPVRAIANGDVSIIASFRTPDGSTVLYQSSKIQVRVRSDWETRGLGLVAILLGLLLLVGLTRGVRRGRGRTRIPPESVPDPDDIGRVAVPDVDEPARDGNAASDDGVPAPETAAGDDPRGTPEPAPHDRGHALEPAPSRRRARGRHAAAPAGPPAVARGPDGLPEPVPAPPDHRPAGEAVEVSTAAVPAGTAAGAVAAAG
ncbi:MAG: DUF6049 family protein, partial [Kineosporiaceae bacterium]